MPKGVALILCGPTDSTGRGQQIINRPTPTMKLWISRGLPHGPLKIALMFLELR